VGRRYFPYAQAAYGERALISTSDQPDLPALSKSLGAFVRKAVSFPAGTTVVRYGEDPTRVNYVLVREEGKNRVVLAVGAPRTLAQLVDAVAVTRPAVLDDGESVLEPAHVLASQLVQDVGDTIVELLGSFSGSAPPSVFVTGHSMGGSIAALTALYLLDPLRTARPDVLVRGWAFGPLPFVSPSYAQLPIVSETLITVVMEEDLLPRASAPSVAARITLPLLALLDSPSLTGSLRLGDISASARALLSLPPPQSQTSPLVVGGTVIVLPPQGGIPPVFGEGATLGAGLKLSPNMLGSHLSQSYARRLQL